MSAQESALPTPMPTAPGPCQLCSSVPLAIIWNLLPEARDRENCLPRLLLGLDLRGKKEQDPPLHVLLVIESLSTADTSPISGGSPHYPSATREGSPQYSCELNMQPNELILLVCKRIEKLVIKININSFHPCRSLFKRRKGNTNTQRPAVTWMCAGYRLDQKVP